MAEARVNELPKEFIEKPKEGKVGRPKGTKIVGHKYYTRDQLSVLLNALDSNAKQRTKTGIKEQVCVKILLGSGLRVAEASNLRVGDLLFDYGQRQLLVRNGKGGHSRVVPISEKLKRDLVKFLRWKTKWGESLDLESPLILSQRGGHLKPDGWRGIIRKWLEYTGLYRVGCSCHSLRHSAATALYAVRKDLRCVQKFLGHRAISSTQIYAHITESEMYDQVERMWS
jgi:integrase/recombinase XerD